MFFQCCDADFAYNFGRGCNVEAARFLYFSPCCLRQIAFATREERRDLPLLRPVSCACGNTRCREHSGRSVSYHDRWVRRGLLDVDFSYTCYVSKICGDRNFYEIPRKNRHRILRRRGVLYFCRNEIFKACVHRQGDIENFRYFLYFQLAHNGLHAPIKRNILVFFNCHFNRFYSKI